MRRTTVILPLALVALSTTGCGGTFKKDAPDTLVRDFLSVALVEQNGQMACDYMTQKAQLKIARAQGTAGACRGSLERAELVEGNEPVNQNSQVNSLEYSETESGETAKVTVKLDGKELKFDLKKDAGLGNVYEPESPWRITGGAEALLKSSN